MGAVIVFIVLFLLAAFFIFYKKPGKIALPVNYPEILFNHVGYYRKLSPGDKMRFEEKIKSFLSYCRIEGINTTVDDLDRLLVASGAVIPVFGFAKWKYFNLTTVLLYPETFNRDEFLAGGYEKNTLGMVGNGAMQRTMILSKPALHHGFNNEGGKENTCIHEFVHLLDKEDGDVDGLPEALLNRKYNSEWMRLVNENMEAILMDKSDINSYGASSKAEFFAVASEYFFNSTASFRMHHSELHQMMMKIYNQDPQ